MKRLLKADLFDGLPLEENEFRNHSQIKRNKHFSVSMTIMQTVDADDVDMVSMQNGNEDAFVKALGVPFPLKKISQKYDIVSIDVQEGSLPIYEELNTMQIVITVKLTIVTTNAKKSIQDYLRKNFSADKMETFSLQVTQEE